MRMWTRRIASFAVILIALVTIQPIISTISIASAKPDPCRNVGKIDNLSFGSDVPVIFIHGFRGSKGDWGSLTSSDTFSYKIHTIDGVSVAHSFEYPSGFWVDHKDSGPKLAKVIDCIAQTSWQNGGKGKVILIGYSMGGLVARDALGRRSSDNLRAIADEVGLVVTIGTPHTGTTLPLATGFLPKTLLGAFTPGSPELQKLPHFPSQVVVHTIAGDVTRVYENKQGMEIRRDHPYDDTLVSMSSASAEYSVDGASSVITCEKHYRQQGPNWLNRFKEVRGMAPCEHQNLIKDPNNGVRDDVVESIQKYLAPQPKGMKDLAVPPVTFHLPQDWWANIGPGIHGNGTDGIAYDLTSGEPCSNCASSIVYASMYVLNYSSYCSGSLIDCDIYPREVVGSISNFSIGGIASDIAVRYVDKEYGGTGLMWCVTSKQTCVFYRRSIENSYLLTSILLYEAFNNATWQG